MARPVELVASYWSISGDCYAAGPSEVSPFDFRDRIEAAAKVGFQGVGLVHEDIQAVSRLIGYDAMKSILDDNGMKYVEVEVLFDWFGDGDARRRSDVVRTDLLDAAGRLGARHIKIVGGIVETGDTSPPSDRMMADFRELCDQAAGVGTSVVVELLPFSNLVTPEQGLALVRGAGAKNGGLMIDVWHMARAGIGNDRIRALPKDVVTGVEIDDARAEVELPLYHDTVHNRELPGEGDLDIRGFLEAVRDLGYDGPYGVEILSRAHRVRPLAEQARLSYETSMKQFEMLGR
ncbi:MAG: sugar phosphate isomerase/epimerase [Bauldia sp.]|nr:sugar phosphate isomerase/epimerase [Bauldia sp.]